MLVIKIDRLIGIITILLQKNKVTAPYLAEQFEVSRRTINRDIDDICKAGIPIITTQGYDGGIMIDEGFKIDKTIFTSGELREIFIGLKSIESISNGTSIKGLKRKLSIEDKGIYALKENIVIDLSSHYKNTLASKIESIRVAIDEETLISFNYYYSKGESIRLIEPYLLVFKWSSWYIFGYCLEKDDFRLFKLNRLWNLEQTDRHFKYREFPCDSLEFNKYYSDEIQLVALFDATEKYRIIEEYGIESFSITDTGKLMFKFKFTSKEYLLNWILSFGNKVEVIEPVELQLEIINQAKGILKKYKQT